MKKKIIINLDWDETITTQDTTELISTSSSTTPDDPYNQHQDESIQKYTKTYLFLLQEYEQSFQNTKTDRKKKHTIEEEKKFLNGFKGIEKQVISLIENDQFFKGKSLDSNIYEKVEFKSGWKEFFSWCTTTTSTSTDPKIEINIISCSWSSSFINSCLDYHQYDSTKFKSIRSNEINRTDGTFRVNENCFTKDGIKSSSDKLKELNHIISLQQEEEDQEEDQGEFKTVYVGDSLNDLECLLESDLGLVMGSHLKLIQSFDRLGIRVIEFKEYNVCLNENCKSNHNKVILRVNDWFEVLKVLNLFFGITI